MSYVSSETGNFGFDVGRPFKRGDCSIKLSTQEYSMHAQFRQDYVS